MATITALDNVGNRFSLLINTRLVWRMSMALLNQSNQLHVDYVERIRLFKQLNQRETTMTTTLCLVFHLSISRIEAQNTNLQSVGTIEPTTPGWVRTQTLDDDGGGGERGQLNAFLHPLSLLVRWPLNEKWRTIDLLLIWAPSCRPWPVLCHSRLLVIPFVSLLLVIKRQPSCL